MNFKRQVVTESQRAAFVCEEIAVMKGVHKNYCSHMCFKQKGISRSVGFDNGLGYKTS